MDIIRIGDIVTRQSHNHDVMFKVVRFRPDGRVNLKGLALRLEADAPINDLVTVDPQKVETLAEARVRLILARRPTTHRTFNT